MLPMLRLLGIQLLLDLLLDLLFLHNGFWWWRGVSLVPKNPVRRSAMFLP